MEWKLTVKQRLFYGEYIKSGNTRDVTIRTGYSSRTVRSIGQGSLAKPDLKSYVGAKMAKIESHKITDAKEILELYAKVLRDKVVEEVPISTTDKVIVIKKKPSFRDKVMASKEIMKRCPLFDPVEKRKLKKLIADTQIPEAEATVTERLDNESDGRLDELMDKLIETNEKPQE